MGKFSFIEWLILAAIIGILFAVGNSAIEWKKFKEECIQRGGEPHHNRSDWMCFDKKVMK